MPTNTPPFACGASTPKPEVTRTKRSPNGVALKPVALRLTPAEREAVERSAAQRQVSMARFAAECFRVGLDSLKNTRPGTSARKAQR